MGKATMEEAPPAIGGNLPPKFEVRPARTLDDMMMVVAIRALVYCGEQACPYAEEFDGNDLMGTHLLGFVDGEPAATIRLRYFGGFAKHERTTVRKEFRGTGIAAAIMDYSLEFLRRKGFRTVYAHSAAGLEKHWGARGWEFYGDEFRFSGLGFMPMRRVLDEPETPFDLNTDHHLLNRPEGEWDRPGVLDLSATR
jgi:predicted GNAT family N-acyltransferase